MQPRDDLDTARGVIFGAIAGAAIQILILLLVFALMQPPT